MSNSTSNVDKATLAVIRDSIASFRIHPELNEWEYDAQKAQKTRALAMSDETLTAELTSYSGKEGSDNGEDFDDHMIWASNPCWFNIMREEAIAE